MKNWLATFTINLLGSRMGLPLAAAISWAASKCAASLAEQVPWLADHVTEGFLTEIIFVGLLWGLTLIPLETRRAYDKAIQRTLNVAGAKLGLIREPLKLDGFAGPKTNEDLKRQLEQKGRE